MKIIQLLFTCSGIFSLNFVPVSPLLAQCIQADIGVQADVSEGKANQTYNRDAYKEGPCTGNANITTGTQINVTGSGVNQHREVEQRTTGGKLNRSGIEGPHIQPGVNVQIDADNVADGYEPNVPSKPSRYRR
jgi:hypothetical protein